MTRHAEVLVVGGGQAGLAAGYYLRRLGVDFAILDTGTAAGGAWQHAWDSLRLFSPAAYSSLPGRLMPAQPGMLYPDAGHVVAYLADYEKRYQLPVQYGTKVRAVRRDGPRLRVETDTEAWQARAVISATGIWSRPFLPDGVDGRALFDVATARRRALDQGHADTGGVASLGNIVAVPTVRAARDAASWRPSRCSPASPPPASPGPTAPRPTPTRSSGALVSGPPWPTSRRSPYAAPASTSQPREPARWMSRSCTSRLGYELLTDQFSQDAKRELLARPRGRPMGLGTPAPAPQQARQALPRP